LELADHFDNSPADRNGPLRINRARLPVNERGEDVLPVELNLALLPDAP
jgi:hypothetical protein